MLKKPQTTSPLDVAGILDKNMSAFSAMSSLLQNKSKLTLAHSSYHTASDHCRKYKSIFQ